MRNWYTASKKSTLAFFSTGIESGEKYRLEHYLGIKRPVGREAGIQIRS
jgi:hypothetical protein